MSNAPTTTETLGRRPEWTLGDRLAKARRAAGYSVNAAAAHFGLNPKTINNYESDRTTPGRAVVLQWALWTGYDARWLEHGIEPDGDPGTPGDLPVHGSPWNLPMAPVVPLVRAA